MEHGGIRTGSGRPKGSKASHTLEAETFRRYLIQETIKNKEAIVASLIEQAKAGKIPAIKEILDKVIGKTLDLNELQDIEENEKMTEINALLKKLYDNILVKRNKQN